jgi:hypothetical protein
MKNECKNKKERADGKNASELAIATTKIRPLHDQAYESYVIKYT